MHFYWSLYNEAAHENELVLVRSQNGVVRHSFRTEAPLSDANWISYPSSKIGYRYKGVSDMVRRKKDRMKKLCEFYNKHEGEFHFFSPLYDHLII